MGEVFLVGHYGEDVNAQILLANCIISLLKKTGEIEFRRFRFLLYEMYADLLKDNIDIKLPHYWYIDGPHIYLKGLPAVFKLRVEKSKTDHNVYKVTILLDSRIE